MRNFRLLILLFCSLQIAKAQSNYFYYYQGQKIYINLDREYVSVNSSANTNFLNAYILNYQSKSEFAETHTRNYVQTMDSSVLNRRLLKNYYCELKVSAFTRRTLGTYSNFIANLNTNALVIKASPCFKTIIGSKRLGLTNNFYVKINPSNVSTLYTYADNNNLEVLGKDPYMPKY